jgi:predicted hydrocarbon binding protein
MPTIEELQRRIEELERENRLLREGLLGAPDGPTVVVPDALRPDFDRAQRTVCEFFRQVRVNPTSGFIEIGDERYVLVRASGLSIEFHDAILGLYGDRDEKAALAIGKGILFDIAHSIGINDARKFHERMGLTDPVARLSAGPVHFAHSGWALVDIKPTSNPVPSQEYLLCYDHRDSFEAASWINAGRRSTSPVCVMSAGYSSGWCEESFGIELTAVEVSCRARGDATCSFVMAPPGRIAEQLERCLGLEPGDTRAASVDIPTYFDRKRREEERDRLIQELQAALARIKTLRGLVPICSGCKKVRDDDGYWHQVEAYLARHSEAEFSHGLCPECRTKLYGEDPKSESKKK